MYTKYRRLTISVNNHEELRERGARMGWCGMVQSRFIFCQVHHDLEKYFERQTDHQNKFGMSSLQKGDERLQTQAEEGRATPRILVGVS